MTTPRWVFRTRSWGGLQTNWSCQKWKSLMADVYGQKLFSNRVFKDMPTSKDIVGVHCLMTANCHARFRSIKTLWIGMVGNCSTLFFCLLENASLLQSKISFGIWALTRPARLSWLSYSEMGLLLVRTQPLPALLSCGTPSTPTLGRSHPSLIPDR